MELLLNRYNLYSSIMPKSSYSRKQRSFLTGIVLLLCLSAMAQTERLSQSEMNTAEQLEPIGVPMTEAQISETSDNCISPAYVQVYIQHSDKLGFRWNAVVPTPAQGYEYDISQTNSPPSSSLETNETFSTEVAYGSLQANTTYYFWVRSICDGQFGPWISSGPINTLPYVCVNAPDGTVNTESIAISCNTGFQQITDLPISPSFAAKITILPNKTYAFKSSIPTDYITVAEFTGINYSIYAHGQGTVYWNSYITNSPNVRFFVHSSANCGTDNSAIRYRYVSCQDEIESR